MFARQEETETLDPERTTAISSAEVSYLLYDTLTSLDYDNTVKPGLAEKWEIAPDGKTYTFTLRRGVRFHSGKPLTSSDVKFTLDRWRALKGSPTAFNISPVERVDAPTPTTVILHLKEPLSILLVNLGGYSASILNQDFLARAGDDYGTAVGKVDGTLSFLGLGAQPPTPEWGAMVFLAKDFLDIAPHMALFPIGAIFVTVLGFNFLGDGLRDALDPRLFS